MEAKYNCISKYDDGNLYLQLFLSQQAHIKRTIARFFKSKSDIADMFQEVYLAGWTSFPDLKVPESFPWWIRRIACRVCMRELSRPYRQWELLEVDDVLMQANSELLYLFVSDCLARQDSSNLSYWPKKLRNNLQNRVGMCYYFTGTDLKEICKATGLNKNTALSYLRRFRAEFREIVEKWQW